MQEDKVEVESNPSFGRFLSRHRTVILIILFLSLALRVTLTVRYALPAGDESRYTRPAINMIAGRGFTSDVSPPYLPSEHVMPLYPVFIAAIYAVFGENNSIVRVAQGLVDLVTCLLVAFVALNLAPPKLRALAAISSLAVYGFLSWFTVNWTRYILTETLALFFTMLAIAVSIVAMRRGSWLWFVVGATCGLALLTRADSVLLVSAFLLFLIFELVRRRRRCALASLLLFCLAIPVVLAPWVAHNFVAFRKFQPLASEYGFARDSYMPNGYLWWVRTWMTDETYSAAFRPAFSPGDRSFDPRKLPDSVFDSGEEKHQVLQIMDEYDRLGRFTPEMSDEFRAIANERIKRAPFRFFVRLPITRVTSVWLTGFATHNRGNRGLRILLVLPILVGGVLGFVFWARNQPLTQLLLLVILTRTIFLAYHYSPESRYIVEAYPAMIAACGLSGAVLLNYLDRVWNGCQSEAGIRVGSP